MEDRGDTTKSRGKAETRNRQKLMTFVWTMCHPRMRCMSSIMASTSPYVCPLCTSPSSTLKLYVSHLRVMHSKDPSFNILCGIGDCWEVFRTFSAFNSHVYRHHRSDLGMTPDAPIISLPQTYDLGVAPHYFLVRKR